MHGQVEELVWQWGAVLVAPLAPLRSEEQLGHLKEVRLGSELV